MNDRRSVAASSVLAQLTMGVDLPLPKMQTVVLDVISNCVAMAWSRIPEDQMKAAEEPALNAMLEAQLNRLSDEDGRWNMLVVAVERGREAVSFDGSHLEKRPDISFVLSGDSIARNFPLMMECKLIDRRNQKSVGLYCGKGVKRFVEGEYCWARPDGLMLAYVRDSTTIEDDLAPYLEKMRESTVDPYRTRELPTTINGMADVAQSIHVRVFAYPVAVSCSSPGPIALRHVWLRNPAAS